MFAIALFTRRFVNSVKRGPDCFWPWQRWEFQREASRVKLIFLSLASIKGQLSLGLLCFNIYSLGIWFRLSKFFYLADFAGRRCVSIPGKQILRIFYNDASPILLFIRIGQTIKCLLTHSETPCSGQAIIHLARMHLPFRNHTRSRWVIADLEQNHSYTALSDQFESNQHWLKLWARAYAYHVDTLLLFQPMTHHWVYAISLPSKTMIGDAEF